MSNSKHFEAQDTSLTDVFKRCQDSSFIVPRYQRQYSWDTTNIEDFWADIKSNHMIFFGSFLYTLHENDSSIDIVDGQQRITTVTIFISLVRNLLADLAKNAPEISKVQAGKMSLFAKTLENNYIWKDDFDDDGNPIKKQYIVHNKDNFKDIFYENIQKFDLKHKIIDLEFKSDREEYLIVSNYTKLKELIENDQDFKDALATDKVHEYFFKLVKRFKDFKCVEIEIRDESLAYEYFDAVNAKGVELTISNLLRNLFLKNLTEADRQSAEYEWNEIEEKIKDTPSASLDQFFNYYWCAKREYISGGGKKLYRAIKKETEEYSKEKWNLLLVEIGIYCDHYINLLRGGEESFKIREHQKRKKFYRSIMALRTMNNSTWIVIMMNYLYNLKKYQNKGIHPDKLAHLMEYFVFNYFTVLGLGGNTFFQLMHDYCGNFNRHIEKDHSDSKFKKTFNMFKDEIENLKPDDKNKYIERASDRILYSSNALAKYVLRKIEIECLNNSGLPNDHETEAEHILPRSPFKKWKIPKKDIKPAKTINMLGNLTLLEDLKNSACDNKIFIEKKPIYKTSTFKLAIDLSENSEWNDFNASGKNDVQKVINVINKRTKLIVEKYVYTHWVTEFYNNL
ncbi:MAG: DUF262 domain-containing protein [Candidatus Neomarinimicrobiota bacterium]